MVVWALLLLFFASFADGFQVSHLQQIPLDVDPSSRCFNRQYWSFRAEYCPNSARDHEALSLHRLVIVFTDTSTSPPRIANVWRWTPNQAEADGASGVRGSFADNNRCGRCMFFDSCENTKEYEMMRTAKELHKKGSLGVEAFVLVTRASGLHGDNEINYGFDPSELDLSKIDEKGERDRYGKGAIRYKRLKIIGFNPVADLEQGMNTDESSEFVLADMENNCDLLEPKTYIPGHGLYRLMVEGDDPKAKNAFWWKSQYYYPIAWDYFT